MIHRASAVSERIYVWLLGFYPAEFREEHGAQMRLAFRDRCREQESRRGIFGLIGLWLETLADLAATAPAEHFDTLRQDLRYCGRSFARSPGFTAVAVLTLALGIGANSLMFSVVNAVLLRPLPYKDPDRLVYMTEIFPRFNAEVTVGADFLDWQDQNRSFEHIAAYSLIGCNATGPDGPERLRCGQVSADFFSLLGVQPALGRSFLPEEDRPGADNVVIAVHGYWQRRFGADPSIIGKTLRIDGQESTIIGVLPATFQFPLDFDLVKPLALNPEVERKRQPMTLLRVIAGLRSGVSLEQARSDLEIVTRRLEAQYPQGYKGAHVKILPLQEQLVGNARRSLLILLAAVGFVLLIACANLTNLLLARAASRQREIAIRTALGARRRRIIRQLLTEHASLSLLGGLAGFLLSVWGLRLFVVVLPPGALPRAGELNVDARVFAFTLGVSILAGLLFGIAPAVIGSASPRLPISASPRLRVSVSGFLVIAEVALALVLLIGAGLMIHSFLRLRRVDPGFRPESVLAMAIQLTPARYPRPAQRVAFFERVADRISSLPGVRVAGLTSELPSASGNGPQTLFAIEGQPPWPPEEDREHLAQFPTISPGYFRAMGIPVVKGREFNERDSQGPLAAVIVNEALAMRFFPQEDPVGRRLKLGVLESPAAWLSIVGVVKNARPLGPDLELRPAIYVPYRPDRPSFLMHLVVRTDSNTDPLSLAAAVRQWVAEIDPDQPVHDIQTMQQRLDAAVAPQRFRTALLGTFAVLALALAVVGIYGVLSYAVTNRTREIGVRIALGAQALDVLKMVLGQSMALVLAGLALGLAAAWVLTRFLAGLLYEISARDPITFLAVAVFLVVVALVASYIPARRATCIDPMEALRYE